MILLQIVAGLGAAVGYVPMTAVLNRWFSTRDRGLAFGSFGVFGNYMGDLITFLAIPVSAWLLFASPAWGSLPKWRLSVMAVGVFCILVGCLAALMLRSAPAGTDTAPAVDKSPRYWSELQTVGLTPRFASLAVYWATYVVTIRLIFGPEAE